MDELIKVLGRFIRRDFGYILGGVSVVVSFLYYFGYLECIREFPIMTFVFIAGIGYVVGFIISEFFSLIGITTTADYFELKPEVLKNKNFLIKKRANIIIYLYEIVMQKEWEHINFFDQYERQIIINKFDHDCKVSKRSLEQLERIISFMLLGNTMGSCGLVSGILLFIRSFFWSHTYFDWILTIFSFLFGLLFLGFGWIKAIQQMEFNNKLFKSLNEKEEGK